MSKSVAEKLTIKPNTTLWLSDDQHLARIKPLPDWSALRFRPLGGDAQFTGGQK